LLMDAAGAPGTRGARTPLAAPPAQNTYIPAHPLTTATLPAQPQLSRC